MMTAFLNFNELNMVNCYVSTVIAFIRHMQSISKYRYVKSIVLIIDNSDASKYCAKLIVKAPWNSKSTLFKIF